MAVVTDKLAFFHIPRTGGSWVRRRMGRYHKKTRIGLASDALNHNPPPSDLLNPEHLAFTVVRQPDAWLSSWFRYLKHNAKALTLVEDHIYSPFMFDGCRRDSFEVFLADYLDRTPGLIAKTLLEFVDRVDVVLRTESLTDGVVELFASVGMTEWDVVKNLAPLRGVNATPEERKDEIPAEWTPGLRCAFEDTESALFGRIADLKSCGEFMYSGGRVREAVAV